MLKINQNVNYINSILNSLDVISSWTSLNIPDLWSDLRTNSLFISCLLDFKVGKSNSNFITL
jgi:hypothetical protein